MTWPAAFVAVGSSFAAAVAIIGGIRAWRAGHQQKAAGEKYSHADIVEKIGEVKTDISEVKGGFGRLDEKVKTLFRDVDRVDNSVKAMNELVTNYFAAEGQD